MGKTIESPSNLICISFISKVELTRAICILLLILFVVTFYIEKLPLIFEMDHKIFASAYPLILLIEVFATKKLF